MGNLVGFNVVKRQKLSKQIFIALFIILIVTILIIGSITYSMLITAYSNQIAYSQERTLQQTERTTNSIIRGIEQSVIAFSINQGTRKMISELRESNYTNIGQIIASLRELRNSNKIIDSVYIYLDYENKVLSSENGIWHMAEFYDIEWNRAVPLNQKSKWIDTREFVDNTGENTQVMSHITLLSNETNDLKDYLIVNLSVVEVSRNIESNVPIDGEFTLLVAGDGLILASNNRELNGKNMSQLNSINSNSDYFETMIQSFYNGWLYINYIPTYYIEQKVGNIAIKVSLILFVWLIIGVIIAKIITSRISNPYSSIIDELQQQTALDDLNIKSSSEADLFRLAFKKVMQQNQSLSEKIVQDEIGARDSVARFLLLGNNMGQNMTDYYFDVASEVLGHSPYHVILVSIDNANKFFKETTFNDRMLWLFCIHNIVCERLGEVGKYLFALIGKGHFTYILSSQYDESQIVEKLQKVHKEIGLYLPLSVTISISDEFDDLKYSSQAFYQCQELAKHKMEFGSSVIYESIIERGSNNDISEFMSILKRDQLNVYISNGSIDQIESLIDRITKSYSLKPNHMPETIFLMMSTILSDIVSKTIDNGWALNDFLSEDRNLYQELAEQETIVDIGRWLKDILKTISPALCSKKGAKNTTIIDSIVNHMVENYGEDIRLDRTAETVFLSAPYLSRLFKQETGMNFSEKLTAIRVDAAKDFLINSNEKIQSISERCNLGSTNNFIRIFKKYEGLTPGQFRSKYAKESMKYEE